MAIGVACILPSARLTEINSLSLGPVVSSSLLKELNMSSWKERLMTVIIFVMLLFAVAHLAPFILTSASYHSQSHISPSFPIAITEQGVPSVIYWSEYEKILVKPELILTPMHSTPISGDSSFLSVKMLAANEISIVLREDNYKFWSSYTIEDGKANPKTFRYSGAFVIGYGLIVAIIGSSVFSFFRKRYLKTRLNKRRNSAA